MSTRGDLIIVRKDERNVELRDRFKINFDADLQGMQNVIKKAYAINVYAPFINKIIASNISMFELNNKDIESGYTYLLNLDKNTIKANYIFCSEYKELFNGSVEDFISKNISEEVGSNLTFYLANYNTEKNIEIFEDFDKAKNESIDNCVYKAILNHSRVWFDAQLNHWIYEDKLDLILSTPILVKD
jgi:hypothetical protein